MDYSKLQNGSDVRGVAMEGVAGQPVNLTGEAAEAIAAGFVTWLRNKQNKQNVRIAIGRDSMVLGSITPDLSLIHI